jgi:GNAT superfamily N-acetyltransferase
MILRSVQAADVKAILSLDVSYATDWVWQMEQKVSGSEIATYFRTTRLPRPLKVDPATDWAAVTDNWQERNLFIVATEGDHILGYLDLTADRRYNIGWIDHVAVAPVRRRAGIGSALVAEARAWSKRRKLGSLMAETQTKNYPAIRFLQKCGFTFCGFNDRLYPQRDIVVFFSFNLD